MRKFLVSLFCALGLTCLLGTAQAAPPTGITLSTDYPSQTLQAGQTSSVSLRLHNEGMAPQELGLTVEGVPMGWTATVIGDGRPVAAAMPASGDTLLLQLRLKVPKEGTNAAHRVVVKADGGAMHLRLPLTLRVADRLPARVSVSAELPQLTGAADSSFDYQLDIKNESGEQVLVSLAAEAPQYFDTSFTEGYGSQRVNAVPIKGGETKNVKLHVRPPANAATGEHEITVKVAAEGVEASTTLKLDVTGQPRLDLSGPGGLMSASAQIDTMSTVRLVLGNSGSAVAQDIALAGTVPDGWKIRFEPDHVAQLEPGKTSEVQAQITPSAKSLAGDYMVKLRASSGSQSTHGDLRVSVTTSSLWGVTGAVLIAIALLVLIGAVARYGRR